MKGNSEYKNNNNRGNIILLTILASLSTTG